MKFKYILVSLLLAILAVGVFVAFILVRKSYFNEPVVDTLSDQGIINDTPQNENKENKANPTAQVTPSGTEPDKQLIGGDKDAHGCLPSAGYTWCEVKQKCLRVWEEMCITDADQALLEKQVKQQIVDEHGAVAQELNVVLKKLDGDYAEGEAGGQGGGGMWFAAKVNGAWKLVWDGNGIILCKDVAPYPNFPTSLIPECYNDTTSSMVQR